MPIDAELRRVRAVAESVLDRLGGGEHGMSVTEVRWSDDPGMAPRSQMILDLRDADGSVAGCYFALFVSEAEAVAALASHLQDAVIESSGGWGRPVPRCPGHAHPMEACVAGGVAVWECPVDASHHREPILAADANV